MDWPKRLHWFARAGYVARGLVFLGLAYFSGLAAVGATARPIDSKEALGHLLSQPFGEVLLAAMAAGLLCFGLWRLTQFLIDPDCYGTDAKGWTRRYDLRSSGTVLRWLCRCRRIDGCWSCGRRH